ncbi:hypothetical protein OUZ56_012163 [Daphnia magna]|uniref:Uncharacterized protein n=1 Tax=Daphnia magna TaxID=35525 RepID=A0ABQ9Z280_9CRUS|nr:hypothetical protein OUZ56_012163 [Daphnia magna]
MENGKLEKKVGVGESLPLTKGAFPRQPFVELLRSTSVLLSTAARGFYQETVQPLFLRQAKFQVELEKLNLLNRGLDHGITF